MSNEKQESELWRRKFEPVTDWRPASGASSCTESSKTAVEERLAQAQKAAESFVKILESIAVEARDKIKDVTSVLDEAVGRSSGDVRSFVAKALEGMADRIKPK
jgi:ribosomal protein L22